MKPCFLAVLVASFVPAALAGFRADAGASCLLVRNTEFEFGARPLNAHESRRWGPYLAGSFDFAEHLGVRVGYQYFNGVATTAVFSTPPGSPLAVITPARYEDNLHILSVAPTLRFAVWPGLSISGGPQLNWVASRGTITYFGTLSRRRDENGFTAGGAVQLAWSVTRQAALTLGYQYLEVGPSFGRKAHVVSGGAEWTF